MTKQNAMKNYRWCKIHAVGAAALATITLAFGPLGVAQANEEPADVAAAQAHSVDLEEPGGATVDVTPEEAASALDPNWDVTEEPSGEAPEGGENVQPDDDAGAVADEPAAGEPESAESQNNPDAHESLEPGEELAPEMLSRSAGYTYTVAGNGRLDYDSRSGKWTITGWPAGMIDEGYYVESIILRTTKADPFPSIHGGTATISGLAIGSDVQVTAKRWQEAGYDYVEFPLGKFIDGNNVTEAHPASIAVTTDARWGLIPRNRMIRGAQIHFKVTNNVPVEAIPEPGIITDGRATIRVFVGSDRTTGTGVTPLQGAKLQLHRNNNREVTRDPYTPNPEPGNYHWGKPGTLIDADWARCVSDAQGWCTFTVPAPNKVDKNSNGIHYWVSALEAPAGYDKIDRLRIGFSGGTEGSPLGSGSGPSHIIDYAYRTPALFAGSTVKSGDDGSGLFYDGFKNPDGFMNTRTAEYVNISAEGVRHARSSSGAFLFPRHNPALPQRCGLRLHLIFDTSTSVTGSGLDKQYKANILKFIDSIEGTGTELAISTFATDAEFRMGPTLMDAAGVQKARGIVNGRWRGGSTNWDAALRTAADYNDGKDPESRFDAVLFITDGNPTRYIDNRGRSAGPGVAVDFHQIEAAAFTANKIKGQGTRIYMFGVGAIHVYGGADSTPNFQAVAGPAGTKTGAPQIDHDWFHVQNMNDMAKILSEVALRGCNTSVTVEKETVDNGQVAPGGAGWSFSAGSLPAGMTWQKDSGPSQATDDSSTARFEIEMDTHRRTGSLTITENMTADQAAEGWRLVKQPYSQDGGEGDQIATCTDTASGAEVAVTQHGQTGFTLAGLGYGKHYHCKVVNARMDEKPEATLRIVKTDPAGQPLAGAEFTVVPGTEAGPDQDATPLTLIQDGHAVKAAQPVQPGIYWVTETRAPDGYSLLATPIGLRIAQADNPGAFTATLVGEDSENVATATVATKDGSPGVEHIVTLTIENQPIPSQLPDTGGGGVLPYAVLAALAIVAGARGLRSTRAA